MAITAIKKFTPGHYLQDKSSKRDPAQLAPALAPGFVGALVDLPWARLEPTKGQYDFALITDYLRWGEMNNRQLIFILMDRDFRNPPNKSRIVPRWVPSLPFNDGIGAIAKIWTPEVSALRAALIGAIAAQFDGHPNLEALVLPETALGGITERNTPGYTHAGYCNEICKLIRTVAPVLKQTQLWQSLNWLGPMNSPYLQQIVDVINDTGIGGVTNPDTVPWERDAKPMYAVMQRNADRVAIAIGNDTSQLDRPGGAHYATFAELVAMQRAFAAELGAHYQLWNNGFDSQAASGAGLGREYLTAIGMLVADASKGTRVEVPLSLRAEEGGGPDPVGPLIDQEELRGLIGELEGWLGRLKVAVG